MQRFRWRGALVTLAAAAMVVAVAAGFTVHKSAADIHIAMIAPLTGPYVFVGGPERHEFMAITDTMSAPGRHCYRVAVSANRPASDYTARIVPHYDGVSIPLEATAILWQR